MINKEEIFPIGIGTWKIDYKNIEDEMNSLLYSYEQGQNYLSLYMLYDNGEVDQNEIDGYTNAKIVDIATLADGRNYLQAYIAQNEATYMLSTFNLLGMLRGELDYLGRDWSDFLASHLAFILGEVTRNWKCSEMKHGTI